ncbi:undecaprenyl-diphosphate phosphatase [Propioniciclava tarda]|uniref:Undecaprenyl-diphosphatase n=1 Tax=Propioniciclava tarda TaxID=433330 RepID=A0A4Q9KMW1_PROTD|nr:undecaprenyl-diphosphate phosphatase [Propioniciclava tarda]TBT95585.1 undecaprenyl-diphosphate phosphatase [Propioniciclava tarda]SMO48298.1 undecaprenyl-diphosphatase [Propioniciclava tarda]
MLQWWQSIILGIVEGVTEFLPISSTGHLNVVQKLMGLPIDDPGVTAYTAVIQVGAMAAAIVYFWKDIVRIATGWLGGLRDASRRKNPDFQMGWAVIAGVFVTAVVALAFKKQIEGPLRNLWVIVAALIVWGLVMLVADKLGKQTRGEDSITIKDGLLLGLIQAIALIPGISRSGATISGGLLMGIDRVTATRMSFFLGIPTLLAAGGFEAVTQAKNISAGVGWGATVVGILVSFVVAYASIAWLLKFVASNNFTAFVVYRILVGLAIAALLWQGTILAV